MMAACGSLPTLPPAAVFDPGNPDLAALLTQLQQHTQLTYLHLTLNGYRARASSFAGLTASGSTLKHLHLEWEGIRQQAWEGIFHPGLYMPRLETLVWHEKRESNLRTIPIFVGQPPGLNAAALSRLADCCAGSLRSLTLEWCPDRQPGCVAMDALLRLTSLTSISHNCVTLERLENVRANLRDLQVLELLPPSRVLVQGGAWLQVTSPVRLLVGSSAQEF